MKKLVREFEFSPEQLHTVKCLAEEVSLTETTAGILFSRGIDTAEKIRSFLAPSKAHYLSPFLLKGMKEAKDLLTRARDEEWRVAVFGDYDADGIGASAILSRALERFGIRAYLFVPERADGYGMSIPAIDGIFDEFLPDLIVTVDCGISNRKEVEYIKEQGAFCIVTDHHELPDELPDCIVVNPKLGGDYPYDNLAGAGVAFKLAQALIGEEAYDLVDFAALSTVADSVPLTGENRDIVAEGLKKISSDPRPAFSALLGKPVEVTAQTLAFTIAPRINAAGRMGDARSALRLFTSEDVEEIEALAARLNAYNTERQKNCDEVYVQAESEIAEEGAFGRVVMLAGEDWNAGFVGIVAARLAEEFSRPALLFVRRGEMLKGSARSIAGVNIFEALKHCSEHITEFGGHAQAAGVNVTEENFPRLKAALDEYLTARYTREDFLPTVVVSGEGTENFRTIAHEIDRLEPCGIGNRRPLFCVRAGKVSAEPIKPLSPHLSFSLDGVDFMYFNGLKDLDILQSDLEKTVVFEYNVSTFRGKESVKGFVRCVLYDGRSGNEVELDAFERRLRALDAPFGEAEILPEEELSRRIEEWTEACPYGLVAVAYDRSTLGRYPALKALPTDVFRLTSGSAANTVLYAPDRECDLSGFREIVLLDSHTIPFKKGKAAVYATEEEGDFSALNAEREGLLSLFSAIRRAEGEATGMTCASAARALRIRGVSDRQLVFALAVFEELGLIAFADGRLRVSRGIHTELARSAIYSAVLRRKEG